VKLFVVSFFIIFLSVVPALAESTSLEKVSLQLNWKNQFEFAGYYMAKEKGFYEDAGLDVHILEYNNTVELSKSVTENKHTFAIGYSGTVLDAVTTNDIVFLSAIFQSSPYVLVSLKSSGIKSIQDFKNKKIMIDAESRQNTAFVSMLYANGLTFDAMKIQEPTFQVQSLLDGTTDIAAWYLSNELYTLEKQGIAYDVWNPKDYGFDFYSDMLFTSKKEFHEYPHLVENFRRASLQGWKYAFEHIDETVEVILKKYNTQNKSEGALLYEARILKQLTYATGKKLGVIEKEKIQRLLDIYNLLGMYKTNVTVDTLLYEAAGKFSLTPQENAYLQDKKSIKICVDPNWLPLEAIDEEGRHVGMAADILELIKEKTALEFELVPSDTWVKSMALARERKCDMFPMAMETPSRKAILDFSSAYASSPMVIATKSSEVFVDNLEEMEGKKLSLVEGYAFVELIKMQYPRIDIIEVANLKEGIALVREGKVAGHLEPLITLAYTLREEGVTDVKIGGKFDEEWSLRIATRNDEPLLKTIMQKALESIEEREIQALYDKWLAVKFAENNDYALLYKIAAVALLLVLFGMWRYYEIHKLNKVIQRKNEELNDAYKQYEWLAENMDDVVWVMNVDGGFVYVSPSVAKLRGFSVEEVMSQTFEELICEGSREDVISAMAASIETVGRGETPMMKIVRVEQSCKDGSTVWTEVNSRLVVDKETGEMRFIGLTRDITQNVAYEKELERMAVTDRLTNLYNRHKVDVMLGVNKDLADRYGAAFGIVLLDIDHFKQVNDRYGHHAGDVTLQTFASILQKNSRKSDIVGRWGGEEFIIIVPHATKESLLSFAQNLRTKIEQSHFETVEHITASIGATLYAKTESTDTLVARADEALYLSKENGRNRVTFLDAGV
jgi:diguanylate cyclase (GGDEF)-like protein/PAS domain S-box-containing protein